MEHLSVVIITHNEEKNIGRCIDSVREVADEIVVLDSFSGDNTVAIARSKGAHVVQQSFTGYAAQKNKATALAKYNYILSLDADEALSTTLKNSIKKIKEGFVYQAYAMNRCNHYCGSFIRRGTWYPDKKIRLFDKRLLKWGGLDIHEKIVLPPRLAVYPLKGDLLHYTFDTVEQHKKNNDKYSTIAAQSLYKIGKKTNWLKIIASPAWSFFNAFLLRAGFLEGGKGFTIAYQQARYHFLKYLKLYKLQKTKLVLPVPQPKLNIQTPANAERLPRDIASHA